MRKSIYHPDTKVVELDKCCCCWSGIKGKGGINWFSTLIDYVNHYPIPVRGSGRMARVCKDCFKKYNFQWVTGV